jgi:hypothetical protein
MRARHWPLQTAPCDRDRHHNLSGAADQMRLDRRIREAYLGI